MVKENSGKINRNKGGKPNGLPDFSNPPTARKGLCVGLPSLKSGVFWVVICAKNSKKIAGALALGLSLSSKIVETNWKNIWRL